MKRQRYPRRVVRRNAPQYRGDFLFVTLAQCAMCVFMLSAAYFASGFFKMTELKPAFSYLLTESIDAEEALYQAKTVWKNIEDIPENIFTEKILISVPMHLPVAGTLTSAYGVRDDVFTGKPDFHTGTDIAAAYGTPIEAAYPGRVVEVGNSKVYGEYITLSHGGFETRYCHCSGISAKEGESVSAGETIAYVGSTGRSTGAHLHFEILVDGKSACPYDELSDCKEA